LKKKIKIKIANASKEKSLLLFNVPERIYLHNIRIGGATN
jgi:hypothetical protein